MGYTTEYVVESSGNYSATYDQIRIKTEYDTSTERSIRIEQGNDVVIISESQFKDFMEICTILNKP